MDIEDAQRNNIQMRNIPAPNDLETVDDSPLSTGPVTLETVLLEHQFETDHHETINFQLITSPTFSVILDIPWFCTHNPSINQGARTIHFKSFHCKKHCKKPCHTSSPLIKESQVDVVTTETYDKLPPQFHEYLDVCDKKNANQLPPD